MGGFETGKALPYQLGIQWVRITEWQFFTSRIEYIVAAETIKREKLFKGGNYSRKYSMLLHQKRSS